MRVEIDVRCPHCKVELRFRPPRNLPERVRLECASCGESFWARRKSGPAPRPAPPQPVPGPAPSPEPASREPPAREPSAPESSASESSARPVPSPPARPRQEPTPEPPPRPSAAPRRPGEPRFPERHRPRHRVSAVERLLRSRLLAVAGLAVAVGLATAWLVLGLLGRRDPGEAPEDAPPPAGRQAVAVLPLTGPAGAGEEWMPAVLGEMLTLELGADRAVRTVPREGVARMVRELGPAASNQSLAVKVAGNLGASHLVRGSWAATGTEVRLEVELVDCSLAEPASGVSLATSSVVGDRRRLAVVARRAAEELREGWRSVAGLEPAPEEGGGAGASLLPVDPEALAAYGRALGAFDADRPARAEEQLRQAVARAQEDPWLWIALAEARSALGRADSAAQAADRALTLAGQADPESLPPSRRRELEARAEAAAGRWEPAARLYGTLREAAPDDPEPGLGEARAWLEAGDAAAARGAVEALRTASAETAADPRTELAAARVASAERDGEAQLEAARRAIGRAEARGATVFEARGRLLEAEALLALGRAEDAESAAGRARQLFLDLGDRLAAARADNGLALVRARRGDVAGAEEAFERALETLRELGARSAEAATLANRARLMVALGSPAAARQVFERALAVRRELGDERAAAELLRDLGAVAREAGDLVAAEGALRRALEIHRKRGETAALAETLLEVAAVAAARERLVQAKALYAECRERAPDPRIEAKARAGLAEMLLAEGALAAAREQQVAALELSRGLGDERAAARSRLALASLDLEEGRAAAAESAAAAVAQTADAQRDPTLATAARVVLTRALLARGEASQARRELTRAAALAGAEAGREARFSIDLLDGRVAAAEGNLIRATWLLESLQTRLVGSPYVGPGMEVSLALGEIEMAHGKEAAGRARLEALEGEARARGFVLLAGKAKAARS